MPNWCENILTVEEEFHHLILNEKGEVDFGILVPMPEDLRIDEIFPKNKVALYVYASERLTIPPRDLPSHFRVEGYEIERLSDPACKEELDELYELGRKLKRNRAKYGAETWYDWSLMNWGCKWNAGSSSVNNDKIFFITPWGPPNAWLKALAEKGVEFILKWSEEGGQRGCIMADDYE